MSEAFIGADVERLRSIGDAVHAHANKVDFVERESSYRINRIADIWAGPGSEAFRQEWFGRHAPALRLAADHLKDASQKLRANADQQAAASNSFEQVGSGAWVAGGVAAGFVAGGAQGRGFLGRLWDGTRSVFDIATDVREFKKRSALFRNLNRIKQAPRFLQLYASRFVAPKLVGLSLIHI